MWRPSHLENSYHHSRPAAFCPRFTTGLAFTLSVLPVFHLLPYSLALLRTSSATIVLSCSFLLIFLLLNTETRMKRY
jgi:hypothetical protein